MKDGENTDQVLNMSTLLDRMYRDAENKAVLDYWNGFSRIIVESQELRFDHSFTQKDLARTMKTTQSVISRFENMGRLPSYDFFARLALSFGHVPGMTLMGDFMAVVPGRYHDIVRKKAEEQETTTETFVQNLLMNELERIAQDTASTPQRVDATISGEGSNG